MSVTDNKQIVRTFGDQSTNQHESLSAHVLSLIHNHGTQVRAKFGVAFQQFSGIPVSVVRFLQVVACQQMSITLKHRPNLDSLLTVQTSSPANA